MSGEALAAYADSKIGETFEAERLVGGAWRIKTNAAWLPSGEMLIDLTWNDILFEANWRLFFQSHT